MESSIDRRQERLTDTTTEIADEEFPSEQGRLSFFEDENGQWDHEFRMRFLLERRGTPGLASDALRELEEYREKVEILEENYLRLWKIFNGERAFQSDHERVMMERIAEDIESFDGYVDERPSFVESIRAALVELGEIDLDPMKNR